MRSGYDRDEKKEYKKEQGWYDGIESARAKALCNRCEFKEECLKQFRYLPEGIVGGSTPQERRELENADS